MQQQQPTKQNHHHKIYDPSFAHGAQRVIHGLGLAGRGGILPALESTMEVSPVSSPVLRFEAVMTLYSVETGEFNMTPGMQSNLLGNRS